MSGYSQFKLNGVPIKNPTGFRVENYTLTKSTRVADGTMVMDFVANKLKFQFNYASINSMELDVIIDILWTQLAETKNCFVELTYHDDLKNLEKKAIVYAGSIPRQLHRGIGRLWVWKDVQFSLIER